MPPAKRVQKLRTKRQNLRSKRKGRGDGAGEEKEKTGRTRVGADVSTTSYLRTQGKAYASSRTGRSSYRVGETSTTKDEESKADSTGGRDRRKKVINKKIKRVTKSIKKARK